MKGIPKVTPSTRVKINEYRMSIGKNFQNIRLNNFKRLTKTKFSQLSGLSRQVIDDIESGKSTYSVDSLLRYGECLNKCLENKNLKNEPV